MLDKYKNIFIVGIKGAAMANIAVVLKKMGKNVAGSDVDEEFITDEELNKNNIQVRQGFDPTQIPPETDLIVYSAAHSGKNNPQVQHALEKGIAAIHQIDVINEIMSQHKIKIAICGSHGKTTTSSMLAYCLKEIGANPTYIVGTSSFNGMFGGDYGNGEYIVVEADEYAIDPPGDKTPKFHKLNPDYIIATNIDFDHPDVYDNLDEVKESFRAFFQKSVKKIYACVEDNILMDVLSSFPNDVYKTYSNLDEQYKVDLMIPGKKNMLNASGVITLLLDLGYNLEDIKRVLKNFKGAKRRFEFVEEVESIKLYDDYAHHPNEILATIDAARHYFQAPDRRIIVIFQPHTYSRTEALKNEFVEALAKADFAFIAPIFSSAREQSSGAENISSSDLENIARKKNIENIKAFETKENLKEKLRSVIKEDDVIFTMGAGNVYKLKNDIIEVVKSI